MQILAKWDNLCNDEAWISSALLWIRESGFAESTIALETQVVLPTIFEYLNLSTQAIRNPSTSHTYASFSSLNAPLVLSSLLPHRVSYVFRFTDIAMVQQTPLAFYFSLMSNAIEEDRPPTVRLSLSISSSNLHLEIGDEIVVEWSSLACEQYTFNVIHSRKNLALCQGLLECAPHAPPQPRFDKRHVIPISHDLVELAAQTKKAVGPVLNVLPVLNFELAGPYLGMGWLHLTDVAISEIWEHLFPADSLMHSATCKNAVTGEEERLYSCMWRGACCQLLTDQRSFDSVEATSWVSRTGTSSFDLRVDFSTKKKVVVARAQFTLIVVNLHTFKASPVLHDKAWAEQKYGVKAVEGDSPLVQPKLNVWPKPSFVFPLVLRYSDHDLNGHVNSGRYLLLIEDAKFSALQNGGLPFREDPARWTLRRFWIEYNKEVKKSDEMVIEIAFQRVDADTNTLWIKYEFIKAKSREVCTIVVCEEGIPAVPKL